MTSLLSTSVKITLCWLTCLLSGSIWHSCPLCPFWNFFFGSCDLYSFAFPGTSDHSWLVFGEGSLSFEWWFSSVLCLGTSLAPYSLWGISNIPMASTMYKWKIPKSILWCRPLPRPPHSHIQLALGLRSSCKFHRHLKLIFLKVNYDFLHCLPPICPSSCVLYVSEW